MTDQTTLPHRIREGSKRLVHAAPAPVTDASIAFRDRLRRDTSRWRVLPDFIIIGVHKGGTTALYHYLSMHPQVVPAAAKELHYFQRYYDADPDTYRAMFPNSVRMSAVKRREGVALTGEASPSYIAHPHVPERVRHMVPDVKLIALLRNPVDRAISAFHHNIRRTSYEDLRSFTDAVDRELDLLADERDLLAADEARSDAEFLHHCYLRRGVYVEQLRAWHEQFPREQLLVLQSETLSQAPVETFGRVLDFLGLDEWQPEAFDPQNTNEYPDVDPALRARLVEYFQPHNESLFAYLGERFDWQ